jgi:hypothetical protein
MHVSVLVLRRALSLAATYAGASARTIEDPVHDECVGLHKRRAVLHPAQRYPSLKFWHKQKRPALDSTRHPDRTRSALYSSLIETS